MNTLPAISTEERLRRWRLLLGGHAAEGTGCSLVGVDLAIDRALAALYDAGAEGGDDLTRSGPRKDGTESLRPNVARWLGDIRRYFPSTVVRAMRKDALERLNLRQLLLEPELLEAVEPDVRLVANLIALRGVIPASTRETARPARLALLDVPSFACTPDLFPDLMAAAIKREDIAQWAARHELATARPAGAGF